MLSLLNNGDGIRFSGFGLGGLSCWQEGFNNAVTEIFVQKNMEKNWQKVRKNLIEKKNNKKVFGFGPGLSCWQEGFNNAFGEK